MSLVPVVRATSLGVVQNGGVKCHFVILNNVLTHLNSVFPPMVGAKIGYHFNN